MVKGNYGRVLLTFVLVATFAVSDAVDWNASHIFNPQWLAHAKFHDVAMLNLLTGMCLVALWLLWRRSAEPIVGAKVAALVPIIFWAAFFYITWLVPGTSLQADESESVPRLAGLPLYPNAIIAGFNIVLATLGYYIYRRENGRAMSDVEN